MSNLRIPDLYAVAYRALNDEQREIEIRIRRNRKRQGDDASLVNIERTRRELQALRRARQWADRFDTLHPLNLVRRQMNELQAAGLGFRCLDVQDLLAIKQEWPDWKVGQPIDLSELPVSQRTPERERPKANTGVELAPSACPGRESPNPFV